MLKQRKLKSIGLYRRALVAGLAIAILGTLPSFRLMAAKYYRDDPMAVEPETQDASRVTPWTIDLFYDLLLNLFAHPGTQPGSRAQNVNTIDEVPNSSWFTNRILARPLSIDEAVRGPLETNGPAAGVLTVLRAKSEGAAPGFTLRDTAGETWFVAFDPKSNPEAASAAAVVAMRLFWALGYHQAEYQISSLRRDRLQIDKSATFDPVSGKRRPMTIHDIDPVLAKAAQNADGSYRILASRLLPGKILGGFKYFGTRPDDPNDIVPHEQRRELRALQVFGAWTNLVDIKALNTMDTLITENGKARVRHYLLDVGSTFGIGANGPREWFEGYEHLFEKDKALKRMYTMGLYLQPWQTVKYQDNQSIGLFEGDRFDPLVWKSRVPAAALLQADDDDTFWAARRVMAFSDDMIRALAKTGKYSDPAAEKLLADVLIKRRDKIGQAYLTRINPLVNFSLDPSGVLKFENAAVQAGVVKAASSYAAAWSELNNESTVSRALGETKGSDRLTAPQGLPQTTGAYVVAEVRVVDSAYPNWAKPVRVTFRRLDNGWKLVGLERMPKESVAQTLARGIPAGTREPVAGL
ncbi:MAG: hypothetical protein ABI759_04795 [Candidatus Solibacter sp.]